MKKIITASLFAFSVLAFGLQASAFTYPGGAPTGGGANIAPLNVGPFAQIKQGILSAPFFGSHKVDIKPCQSNSVLVGGGTSCGDIGATGAHDLFKAGTNSKALFVGNDGLTFAGMKVTSGLLSLSPTDVFRAGQFNTNTNTLRGISVNENGQFFVKGGSPNPGDVLSALNTDGAVTWQTPSGGTNLGTGNAGDVLTWDANTNTFVWAPSATGMPTPASFAETLFYNFGTQQWERNNQLLSDGQNVRVGTPPTTGSMALVGSNLRKFGVIGDSQFNGDVYVAEDSFLGINTGGSVNIGTLSPISGAALNVMGTVLANNNGLYNTGLFATVLDSFLAIDPSSGVRVGSSGTPGAKLHIDGNILIDDGTAQPNRILTSIDGSGIAEWRDPAFVNSLPSGLSNRTLRRASDNNPTNWIVANNLQNDGNTVSVLNEGSASNKVFQVKSNLNTTDPASTLLSLAANNRLQILPNSANYAPGKVLTATANGDADWQQVSGTLPTGTINHSTLRWNGTNWVENPKMLADQNGRVAVNTDLSGSATFKVGGNININAGIGANIISGGSTIISGGLILPTAGTPVQGRVLTSDNNGVATWQDSGLPDGTIPNTTLRWSGSEWVENLAIVSTGVNNHLNILGGSTVIGNNISSVPTPLQVRGKARIGDPNVPQFQNPNQFAALMLGGAIQIIDGTEGEGKVLTSNGAGVASWKYPSETLYAGGNMKAVTNRRTVVNDLSATASCGTGYMAISGGVDCEIGDTNRLSISQPVYGSNTSYPRSTSSGSGDSIQTTNIGQNNYPTGWYGKCSGPNTSNAKDITVTAICVKVQ